jgi:hypothetical protein
MFVPLWSSVLVNARPGGCRCQPADSPWIWDPARVRTPTARSAVPRGFRRDRVICTVQIGRGSGPRACCAVQPGRRGVPDGIFRGFSRAAPRGLRIPGCKPAGGGSLGRVAACRSPPDRSCARDLPEIRLPDRPAPGICRKIACRTARRPACTRLLGRPGGGRPSLRGHRPGGPPGKGNISISPGIVRERARERARARVLCVW